MKRVHYLIGSDNLAEIAEDYLHNVSAAVDARNDFADRHGADGVKVFQSICMDGAIPTIVSVTGLRFLSKIPSGFCSSDTHGGYAVPDISSDKGRQIAQEMAVLPHIPVASEIASELGYGSALRILPDGGATAISVEKFDDVIVLNIPQFSEDELVRCPQYSWEAKHPGISKIDEVEYKALKESAYESASRSSLRPGR